MHLIFYVSISKIINCVLGHVFLKEDVSVKKVQMHNIER